MAKAQSPGVKESKSVQRAYRKVQRTGADLAAAKVDGDVVEALVNHEKAKTSYGKALAKAFPKD